MLRMTLPAHLIPDGYPVTKATGEKEYTLRKDGVTVYGGFGAEPEGVKTIPVHVMPGCYILQSADSLNVIPRDINLSVHFQTFTDAINFLDTLRMEKNAD